MKSQFIPCLVIITATCASAADTGRLVDELVAGGAPAWQSTMKEMAAVGLRAVSGLVRIASGEDRPRGQAAWKALTTLTLHASPQTRGEYARALLQALSTTHNRDVRHRLVQLVSWTAAAEAIPGLASLLADADLREPAREALALLPDAGAATALIEAATGASGEWRTALVRAIGRRSEPMALAFLRQEVKSGTARIAALAGLGRNGDADSWPLVRPLLRSNDAETRTGAVDAALGIARKLEPAAARKVYDALADTAQSPKTLCAALHGMTLTRSPRLLETALKHLSSPRRDVAETAAQGLRAVPAEDLVPALTKMRGMPPATEVRIMKVLADVAPTQAAPIIRRHLTHPDAGVRRTALRLLGQVGDSSDVNTLAKQADTDEDDIRSAAVDGLLGLGGRLLKDRRPDSARLAFESAFHAAGDDRRRNLALDGVGYVADAKSLPLVEPLIDDPKVGLAASVSAVAIADAAARRDRAAATRIYEQVATRGHLDARPAAIAGLHRLGIDRDFAHEQGFVSVWWVVGSFPNKSYSQADEVYPPEQKVDLDATYKQGPTPLRWERRRTYDTSGIVDLRPLFAPDYMVSAYAYTEITVDRDVDAQLRIGSDDGIKVWLDGKLVHSATESRDLKVDQDVLDVRLHAGVNPILLKVLQKNKSWAFCVRLTDRSGKALTFQQPAN